MVFPRDWLVPQEVFELTQGLFQVKFGRFKQSWRIKEFRCSPEHVAARDEAFSQGFHDTLWR
jgi:hypothetical protein